MELVALILALAWEEIVLVLIAAGIAYLVIEELRRRWVESEGTQRARWPYEPCTERPPDHQGVDDLLEILSLATTAPEPTRTIVVALVEQCFLHDTAHFQQGPGQGTTHCKAVHFAVVAARDAQKDPGRWQDCINELTHAG